MAGRIRVADRADAAAISAIYAPYVLTTTVTFETQPPTEDEFIRRIEGTLSGYPYLVWEENGQVLAYAYAHRYAQRAAYGWAAEASVYAAPCAHGTGAARRLYASLIALLREMNCVHLYAKVAHPNPRSEAFHEAMGFEKVAFLPGIGFKHGQWIGLTYYHYLLCEQNNTPAPIIPFPQLDPAIIAGILGEFNT